MLINMETMQLIAGTSTPVFEEKRQLQCLPDGWVKSLMDFLQFANASIELTEPWMPKMQRADDHHTMDKVLEIKWTKGELTKFQTCRMCLQVCGAACIATMTGDTMEDWAMNRNSPDDRKSPWLWPQLERPPDDFWTKWKEML